MQPARCEQGGSYALAVLIPGVPDTRVTRPMPLVFMATLPNAPFVCRGHIDTDCELSVALCILCSWLVFHVWAVHQFA